jgi:hypothetical protein
MQRFWAKVKKTKTCWLWQASTRRDGYGQFRLNGKMIAAHRLSYTLLIGPIPKDMQVLHSCDVRHCVNPAHFFLGDNAANIQDRMKKGRYQKTTLCPNQKQKIKYLRAELNTTEAELAERFKISRTSIRRI